MDETLNPTENDRRRKIVIVSPFAIVRSMGQDVEAVVRCVEGLPLDCRVVGSAYDYLRDLFVIVVEHPSFEPVPWGRPYPEIEPLFRKVGGEWTAR
jgi:hypothetical protein